jgi:UDP-N-acetyl-D-mannosaminuronic acid dehydrogenase
MNDTRLLESSNSVQIIGLGFVGLTLAAVLAQKSQVVGVDINKKILDSLKSGEAHFYEHGLNPLIKEAVATGRLKLEQNLKFLPERCTYIITVGTAMSHDVLQLEPLRRVAKELAEIAKDEDLIIVRSTVAVGSTREIVDGELVKFEKKTLLAMCPERTIEGAAIQELADLPQIVGGRDKESLHAALNFFASYDIETVPVSSLEVAEMTKLVNNTYRDLQFAFANEIALLCDQLNISGREVIHAANRNYFRSNVALPGITAGPCLEKDPWILYRSGQAVSVDLNITKAGRLTNESTPRKAILQFSRKYPDFKPRSILIGGLAFKGIPETSDIRGSLAFEIIRVCKEVYPTANLSSLDPLISKDLIAELFSEIHYESLDNSIINFDFLILQHNGATLTQEISKNRNRFLEATVLDFWDIQWTGERPGDHAKYYSFGGQFLND